MIPLNLPSFDIKLQGTREHPRVLDVLRRRYVALTPEEWVRQSFIHYLIEHLGYPQTLLANEVPLRVGDKQLRADSVLYDRHLRPKMIIEYKAPTIPITQRVFEQIAAYNILLHVDYLIVSNGLNHYCCKVNIIIKNVYTWITSQDTKKSDKSHKRNAFQEATNSSNARDRMRFVEQRKKLFLRSKNAFWSSFKPLQTFLWRVPTSDFIPSNR